jgi:hypothetical protein
VYLTNTTSINIHGSTYPGQVLSVIIDDAIVATASTDPYLGEFKLEFNITNGDHIVVFETSGSDKPTERITYAMKVDTSITDSSLQFLEVLPTMQITKSELNTTYLTGSIEEESEIIGCRIIDEAGAVHIVNLGYDNLTVNGVSFSIKLNILGDIEDGEIIAELTIKDKIGNIGTVSTSIDLFKFAFSPIVMMF